MTSYLKNLSKIQFEIEKWSPFLILAFIFFKLGFYYEDHMQTLFESLTKLKLSPKLKGINVIHKN